MESDMAALSKSAGLFEVAVPEYKQLKACHRDVRLLKRLWDMIVLVCAVICKAVQRRGRRRSALCTGLGARVL